jgi:PAS domain S-box-containing protein
MLSLRARLIVGFSLMALVALGFAGYLLARAESMRGQMQQLADSQLEVQYRLQDLRETLNAMQRNALQGALNRDRKLLVYATTEAAALFEVFDELRTLGQGLQQPQERAALLQFLEPTQALYREVLARSFATLGELAEGGQPEAGQMARLRLDSINLNSAFASYLSQTRGDNAVLLQQFLADAGELQRIGLAIVALTVLALALFFHLLRHHLTGPLRELESFVGRLGEPASAPDRLALRRLDEIGQVGLALNTLLDRLRDTAVSRDHLNRIIDQLPNAVFVVGPQGQVETVNARACSMLGLQPSALQGRALQQVLPSDVASMLSARGQSADLETELVSTTGQRTPVLVSAARVDSAWRYAVLVATDISERIRHEREVLQALERQRELNLLKTRFVAMASHEFRTPLATIRSSSDLLRHYSDRMPAQERLEMLTNIEDAVGRMTRMLEDVLLIGKSDAGKLDFHPAPLRLRAFCEALAQQTQDGAGGLDMARHQVRFQMVGEADDALFDESLLRQILGNLLSNAVKYSPRGGQVFFGVVCREREVEWVVADQGIGLPEQDLARLFETFFRASNVGTISGTGLGLAIVKRSVELHGGTIKVDSVLGTGTRFTVTLPRVKADETMEVP